MESKCGFSHMCCWRYYSLYRSSIRIAHWWHEIYSSERFLFSFLSFPPSYGEFMSCYLSLILFLVSHSDTCTFTMSGAERFWRISCIYTTPHCFNVSSTVTGSHFIFIFASLANISFPPVLILSLHSIALFFKSLLMSLIGRCFPNCARRHHSTHS